MKVMDPICEMEVESPSKYFSDIENIRYDFCSSACKIKFDQDPKYFINKKKENKQPTYRITTDGRESIDIPIIGMDCASCALTIEKEVNKLSGIKSSHVNYASEKVHVDFYSDLISVNEIVE